MSTQDSRGGAAGLRDRRVARVLDREISPVWHDRFARLIVRNLPHLPEVLALDVHCGSGRTTGELLHRLGAGAKVLAIDPDEGALELAKTRVRPEWKNRVYFKPGHFDDVTAMADDSYNLVVANVVLGETVELSAAIGEMIRVCKIGGRILATLPLRGTWGEVEDIFAEILRDAGLTAALRRLEGMRAIRPTGPQLGEILRKLGVESDDYVVEHERFQLIFPSGREFLFSPVIEHGPLQLWKAIIGKDGAPQELFWRLKEAIDTYYAGHVLSVSVHAGLVHVEVAKGTARPGPRLAARFWRHYPELDNLWGGLAAGYARVSDPLLPFSDADVSDFDIDIDEADPRRRTGSLKAITSKHAVATPSPEEFGLRFRAGSDTSGTRPVDPELKPVEPTDSSGIRPRPPASEASGLRALSRLRDDSPVPAAMPTAPPADEDDFSELNHPAPVSARAPSEPKPRARPEPTPAARPLAGEDDFSSLNNADEDDFSSLNESSPAVRSTGTRRPDLSARPAETPARRPDPQPPAEARRPEPSADTPRPTRRQDLLPSPDTPRPAAEARPAPSGDTPRPTRRQDLLPSPDTPRPAPEARPAPSGDTPRPTRRQDLLPSPDTPRPTRRQDLLPSPDTPRPAAEARPAPSGDTPRPTRRQDLQPSPDTPRPTRRQDLLPSPDTPRPAAEARPTPSADTPRPTRRQDLQPSADTPRPTSRPDPEPAETPRRPEPIAEPEAPPIAAESAPVETPEPARPEPVRPARPAFRSPIAEPSGLRKPEGLPSTEPSGLRKPEGLPTFRPPETPRSGGESSGTFKPPTFKPPAPRESGEGTPIRNMFRPPPTPEPAADDEPAELIDDLEPVEEAPPTPKPPPPRQPPPIGLKPRPLQPIFTPPDKKK